MKPCGICNGQKKLPTSRYVINPTFEGPVLDGGMKNCPGCDGAGVSEKSRKEAAEARGRKG